jgi:rRNA maturation endonuclease Nob1
MSEIIEEVQELEPYEYRCGQCDCYWFKNPGRYCPICGSDTIEEVWDEEMY